SIINNATISITKNCQGLVCDFKANVSGLSSGISASSYKWNFEGVEMSNSPANMSYTFTRAGTYNVKLTVFYNNGSSGFTSASVNVLNSESTGTAGADNFSCSQTGVSVDCTVEIIASRKNLINNALSNGLNIGIIISADNKKVLSSPISRADNKYVYNIPISTLTNNSILLPKNVTFNVKIQESSNILIYDKSFSLQVDSGTNIDSGFGSINQNTTNQGSNDGAGLENTANTNSAQQRQQQNYFNKFLNISQTTGGVSGPTTVSGIADIFLTILQWIFAFALILGIIMVIISGISYMTATGDSTRVGKATNILIYSVIGVAIALISSFVIQIIRGLLS
ncbi:MAG: PKD domain-containing protein, partial [Patescibacteria group bacterium]